MFQESDIGYEFKTENYIAFFGKKNCTLDGLKNKYSYLDFRHIKQTHSDICVQSNEFQSTIEADAHFTTEKNVGLIIKTADCLPIMIYAESNKNYDATVIAVHAGWRGVENQITLKSIKQLSLNGNLQIIIGPHILQKKFEVDESDKDLLVQSAYVPADVLHFKSNQKYFIDLQKIIESQIYSFNSAAAIHKINLDTYGNDLFNSFRTDKTVQRNLSFIAKI